MKRIVKRAFVIDLAIIREEQNIQQSGRESLYYITGWLLRAALKAAKRREEQVREQLNMLVSKASYSREKAVEHSDLPTAKVERVELFGGLAYANEDFFNFVERLEFIFRSTLTPEYLMMNGSSLIDLVYKCLNSDDGLLDNISIFLEDEISSETVQAVTKYITRAYCRMRGKDFARKLMSKDTQSLKQTRRPTLAGVSNPLIHKSKRKKVVEDNVDDHQKEIEYLMFDAATANISTEDKAVVDDIHLLEV